MSKNIRWTEKEVEILKENYCKIKIDNIALLIPNHTRCAIMSKAISLKITNRSKNTSMSRRGTNLTYTHNTNFFDEPSVMNSYWAGFIAADGNFCKYGGFKISISLKDNIINQTFKKHIKYSGDIKTYFRGNGAYSGKGSKCSVIHICSAYNCCEKLNKNWNIPLHDKTRLLIPPSFTEKELVYSYIIGLIDGDGFILRYTKTNKLCLGFCGTYEIVKWMRDIWYNITNVKIKVIQHNRSKDNYSIQASGTTAIKICRELMTVDIPWKLERKWGKVDLLD